MAQDAVQFLAQVLDEYGYGTTQADKDAGLIVSRLRIAGLLRESPVRSQKRPATTIKQKKGR